MPVGAFRNGGGAPGGAGIGSGFVLLVGLILNAHRQLFLYRQRRFIARIPKMRFFNIMNARRCRQARDSMCKTRAEDPLSR
jgi:hypothetical protein